MHKHPWLKTFVFLLVTPLAIYAFAKPKKLTSGTSPTPKSAAVLVNQEFCNATAAYHYESSKSSQGKPQVIPTKAAESAKVTGPIRSLQSFDDPGTDILDLSKSGSPGLMSDGSDSSRLLVRSFSAGTCPGQTPPAFDPKTKGYSLLSADFYIINLVVWSKDAASLQTVSNDWYVFNTKNKSVAHQTPFKSFRPNLSKDTRIYGSSTVGFLAVHLCGTGAEAVDLKALDIEYGVDVVKTQPMNVQDLISLIGIVAGAPIGSSPVQPPTIPSKQVVGLYGGGLIAGIDKLPDSLTITAKIQPAKSKSVASLTPTQTDPAYIRQSAQILGRASSEPLLKQISYLRDASVQGFQAPGNPAPSSPSPTPTPTPTPSATTCSISSSPGGSTSCSFSQQYQDEGLYHWDVSIAVPLSTLKQPNYTSVDGVVMGNTVSKLSAYGFFDVFPVPSDIITPPWFSYPHIAVGLPFSGAVLDKPFFGGAGILNVRQIPAIGTFLSKFLPINFDFYGGVVWDKEPTPKSLAVGSVASQAALSQNLFGHRVWKGQFGVEFSIRDVKSKFTSSTTKKSGS